jgi:GT2 family glycosyltransferase
MPDVSIIIVSWNTRDLLADCLRSIAQTAGDVGVEIVVVDNASADGSQDMLRQRFPHVHLIANPENAGFARAVNQGVGAATARALLLLNSDARLLPNSLRALLDVLAAQPRAAVVGARLCNADGSFQGSHAPFPTLWREFLILSGVGRALYGQWYPSHGHKEGRGPQAVEYVGGACMLVRRDAFAQVGGFDEGYFMYAEEVDFCYVLHRNGWQVWYQPAAAVIHLGGGSSRHRRVDFEGDLYRSRVRFFRKHHGDRAARLLKWQMYGLTGVKLCAHGLLRLASGGRYGRPVVPLRDLAMKLREA